MSRCSKVEAVIGPMSKIGPMSGLMSRCTHGPMSRWSNVEAVIGPMSRPSNVENGSNVEILLWSNVEMVQCRGSNGPMSRQ